MRRANCVMAPAESERRIRGQAMILATSAAISAPPNNANGKGSCQPTKKGYMAGICIYLPAGVIDTLADAKAPIPT